MEPAGMTSPTYEWTFRRVVWSTLILVFVALSFWLLYTFSQVVFILFIAIVIGTVIRPAVDWLYGYGLPRMAGVILVYLFLLTLLIGFGLLLFPLIAEQSAKIAASVPDYYQSLRAWMVSSPNSLIEQLSLFLPINLSIPGLNLQTSQQTLESAGQALGFVSTAGNIIFTATAVFLLAFYWTLYGKRTLHSLMLMVPTHQRERNRELISAIETKVGAYIAGQSVLCLVVGSLALAAYLLIGLPYPLVLALVAGVMEAVPMVGPLLGAIPALIIALSIDPSKAIWVVLATVVIQQMENSLLVPRVMRKAVGVNPFVSLLSLFAFSSLLGVAGALMAIPIAAIVQLLLERYVFSTNLTEPKSAPGRNLASRLRYEAQNLVQNLRKQSRLKKGGSDQRVQQTDQIMDEIETLAGELDLLLTEASTPRTV
jgi:predicted PurR-regulated permease PerM